MGWCIGLGVLLLLAILPIGVGFTYDSDGLTVAVLAGSAGFRVYPPSKTKEKPSKKESTPKPKKVQTGTQKTPDKKGGNLNDFMPLVRVGLDFLGQLRRKIRVRRLDLNLVLGGGDPANLGIQYGRACAALGNLWPRLEQLLVIKKRDVQIQCDFEASQTLVTACVQITITIGRLLALVLVYGFRAIKEFMKLQKTQKGGTIK
jgi:hypothetical protein